MSTERKIGKVNVTIDCYNWWESNLSSILNVPVTQIISAVVDKGGLYLIFWYDEEINNQSS